MCDVGWCALSYYQGNIDEFHFSNSARSADWIAAEYNNQNSPSTFVTVGAEDTSIVILPSAASLIAGQSVQFGATLLLSPA
jgi:hypothetical protein